MAKIYDVYDDFKEEMRDISNFFNLDYNEKKISNEEFVFNLLSKQLTEKKIADCVNILKEQNKAPKKEENPKKEKKAINTNIGNKFHKSEITPHHEEKAFEENDNNKVVASIKEPLKEIVVENTQDIESKIQPVVSLIKDKIDNPTKILKDNNEVTNLEEKVVSPEKIDHKNFERKYFQNGKYVIDGVNVETSVFVKKNLKTDAVEKNFEKQDRDLGEKRKVVNEEVKNKKLKIDCNIDQNLLNGCYWPTQLS